MYVYVCARVCARERGETAQITYVFLVCSHFFPTSYLIKGCNHKASRCSIHIASLPPFLVPPRSLPSRALPSAEETPAGETEALQHGKKSTAVTSPFSAVSHHALSSPHLPLFHCHCTSCSDSLSARRTEDVCGCLCLDSGTGLGRV